MDVYGALADPIRRDLLACLVGGEARAGDLAERHPVSRPAVSRHLRVLREAGLVDVTERGRERHYALDPSPLAEVASLLARLRRPPDAAGTDLGRAADGRPPITDHHLDALETETRRTARDRRDAASGPDAAPREDIA